jgi:hypothetical protein
LKQLDPDDTEFDATFIDRSLTLSSLEAEGYRIENIIVSDDRGRKVGLQDSLFMNKLVFRLPRENCIVCIDSIINQICHYSSSIEGNIILLCSFDDLHEHHVFIQDLPCMFKVFNFTTEKVMNLTLEEYETPYIFFLDSTCCMRKVYVPDKFYPQGIQMYMQIMRDIEN